ncbi:hypothetical protein F5Y16DRAFT_389679 [Xylariaceae sp. FL0255]|nr:hypothetical protein F5Y16DRAFT_389679 [Xylariaceae sp. FL0255]
MPPNRHRPRRHSISSGDESVCSHPAKLDDIPKRCGQRRARLPRSKSTSNMLESFQDILGYIPPLDVEDNIALEQANIDNLRALAKFFRTTAPPPERPAPNDVCMRFSVPGESRPWSLQSRAKNKRPRPQRHSMGGQLPDSAIPGITAEGHRYIAISTPSSRSNIRCQYPVFAPESPSPNHQAWPVRTSSKEFPISVSRVSSRAMDSSQRTYREDPSSVYEDNGATPLSNGSMPELNFDYPLGTVLNTVEEGFESEPSSIHDLPFRKDSTFERPRMAPQPPAPSSILTIELQEPKSTKRDTLAKLDLRTSLEKMNGDVGKDQSSTPVSPVQKGSPRSPGRNSRRPANINVTQTLAVPKRTLQPDSPGFPNMLAAMSFPTPPQGSRPSSPASSVGSSPDSQSSQKLGPVVRPRTSSKRFCTSSSMSAASLDEIVMQKRTPPRHARSEGLVHVYPEIPQALSKTKTQEELSKSTESINKFESTRKTDRVHESRELSITDEARVESSSTSQLEEQNCNRESLLSQLTVTTDSYRQSTLTNSSSSQSSASELTVQSTFTVVPVEENDQTQSATTISLDYDLASSHQKTADSTSDPSMPSRDATVRAESRSSQVDGDRRDAARTSSRASTTSTTNSETNDQAKTIHERRSARKAKVREYKLRDLDASRADTVDSPVLGYFPSNAFQARKPAGQGPSPLPRASKRSSVLSTSSTVTSEVASEVSVAIESTETDAKSFPNKPALAGEPKEDTLLSDRSLRISAVLTTDIEPIYPPSPHWHTSGITMSPVMVVADVESVPGSPTLKFSGGRPESFINSRTTTRPKSLKIIPQSRHPAVTISRNPSTGMIERTASGSVDLKLNRRSLITMPTPPLSPEATQSPRRLSLPPVQYSAQNHAAGPWDRASPSRRHEWRVSPAKERELANRVRGAGVKERVLREKLQKEKEIMDIVAKTVGLAQHKSPFGDDLVENTLEAQDAESLERRLRRLERNNDAWLSAMKPLLETMARTLDDMKAESRVGSLRMSEFIVDMEAEAKRLSSFSHQTRVKVNQMTQAKATSESDNNANRNAVEDGTVEAETQASDVIKLQLDQQEAMSKT